MVADVLTDDALEVPVIEHQDVVEAFATPGEPRKSFGSNLIHERFTAAPLT